MKLIQAKNSIRWLDWAVAATTVLLLAVGITTIVHNRAIRAANCYAAGNNHDIRLAGDAFSTPQLTVKHCDTITISNAGPEEYLLAFGSHDNHSTYPGFAPQTLRAKEFLAIDAIQLGTYTIHDHLRDKAQLEIKIIP